MNKTLQEEDVLITIGFDTLLAAFSLSCFFTQNFLGLYPNRLVGNDGLVLAIVNSLGFLVIQLPNIDTVLEDAANIVFIKPLTTHTAGVLFFTLLQSFLGPITHRVDEVLHCGLRTRFQKVIEDNSYCLGFFWMWNQHHPLMFFGFNVIKPKWHPTPLPKPRFKRLLAFIPHALRINFTFKLGKTQQDVQHEPTRAITRINRLCAACQLHLKFLKLPPEVIKVSNAPAETVYLIGDNLIHMAIANVLKKGLKAGAIDVCTCGGIGIGFDVYPPLRFPGLDKVLAGILLALKGIKPGAELFLRGNPGVDETAGGLLLFGVSCHKVPINVF